MSASAVAVVVVGFAVNLAIGGDTDEAMREHVWRQAGLCDKQCDWDDGTGACQTRQARWRPCEVNRGGNSVSLWMKRNSQDPAHPGTRG